MPLIRTISSPLLARVTVAWGVLFALVHFHWAAGGTAVDNAGDTDAARVFIGFIAVVGLLGAAVGHGFAHDRGARWLGGPIAHPAAGGHGPQIASEAAR